MNIIKSILQDLGFPAQGLLRYQQSLLPLKQPILKRTPKSQQKKRKPTLWRKMWSISICSVFSYRNSLNININLAIGIFFLLCYTLENWRSCPFSSHPNSFLFFGLFHIKKVKVNTKSGYFQQFWFCDPALCLSTNQTFSSIPSLSRKISTPHIPESQNTSKLSKECRCPIWATIPGT